MHATTKGDRAVSAAEFSRRERLQARVTAWLDIVLSVLAIVLVVLIVLELAVALPAPWAGRVVDAQLGIWAVFVAAFVFELAIAPDRGRYLRSHWLVALSLLIPALRVFRVANAVRVLRAGRAVRTLQLARVSTSVRRSALALRDLVRVSQFGYVLLLTVLLTVTSAGTALAFERGADDASISNLGDALWWASAVVTTVNSPLEPVTLEGRLIAFALRVFGLAVVGYLTARVAVYFIGSREAPGDEADRGVSDEVRALREEVQRLTALIEERGEDDRGVRNEAASERAQAVALSYDTGR